MAYTRTTNISSANKRRQNFEQQTAHGMFVEHCFDTQITSTAKAFSTLLNENNSEPSHERAMSGRTHVEITNCNAAGTIYVGRASTLSSTNYQYILNAGGGYVKLPLAEAHDFYLLGSTTLACVVTEVG